MSSEKSLSDVWAARFDDRDDEELACRLWARRLTSREQALAQPFRNFPMAQEMDEVTDKAQPATKSAHPR